MEKLTSADGTTIAVESVGSGPPVVLVVGAFCDRTTTRGLAELLADRFTVHAYDRRGRGDSGAAGPDSASRELEDLAAVVAHAGGTPAVYGHSSGAIIALLAVAGGLGVSRVAAYEPPWAVGADGHRGAGMAERVRALVVEGRHADAVEAFVGPGLPPPVLAGMAPMAPTLLQDLAVVGDQRLPTDRLATIGVPALLLDGGESDAWAHDAVAAAAAAIPGAEHRTIPGQGHGVDHQALEPVLAAFLACS